MVSKGKALSALFLASILASSGIGFAGEKLGATKKSLPRAVKNTDYYDNGQPDPLKVELGKLLFHDKILSGNRNISCATCHHALTDTGDGLSLPVGEGGRGLGVTRTTGSKGNAIHERVPRNAPHVFNLGAKQFKKMFHDGRVQADSSEPSGFRSPAGRDLPRGLDNVLAAQAMFPVTSPAEMAGQSGENNIARAAGAGDVAEVWRLLAARLGRISGYVELFAAVYDDVEIATDISYVHAANAIAAFEAFAWRADGSPFDRYLRGEKGAMSAKARQGMKLFYGKAGCSECHSGKFQTDHRFHAIAMPQIGPGKGNGAGGHEDFGRENVTLNESHRYKFRTPSLRNVALTGPWGHDGAYNTLRAVVEHNLDPVNSLQQYDPSQTVMPSRPDLDAVDFEVLNDSTVMTAIADACELEAVTLSENQIDQLIDFLDALTDPASVDLRVDVPSSVPSGLTLAE
jgi:cytochrome c peroxidase